MSVHDMSLQDSLHDNALCKTCKISCTIMLSVQDDIVFLAKICARYPASFMQDLETLSKKVAKSLEVLQEGVRSCKIAYQLFIDGEGCGVYSEVRGERRSGVRGE